LKRVLKAKTDQSVGLEMLPFRRAQCQAESRNQNLTTESRSRGDKQVMIFDGDNVTTNSACSEVEVKEHSSAIVLTFEPIPRYHLL
jgi:hypothetical protein